MGSGGQVRAHWPHRGPSPSSRQTDATTRGARDRAASFALRSRPERAEVLVDTSRAWRSARARDDRAPDAGVPRRVCPLTPEHRDLWWDQLGEDDALAVLSSFVPSEERLITIEDAAEQRLAQPHVIGLEARPATVEGRGEVTVRDLVRNAIRMRPDRIVVGEVRGGEALDMLQAMNTGHDGSLSTAHANSARHALWRLETMALMSRPTPACRSRVCPAAVPRKTEK